MDIVMVICCSLITEGTMASEGMLDLVDPSSFDRSVLVHVETREALV